MTALVAWRQLLEQMNQCPWPGPRPITSDHHGPEALRRRDRDIELISQRVERSRVVILTGASGVGKSSLLNVGLIPRLAEAGYEPVLCGDGWSSADLSDSTSFPESGRALIHGILSSHVPPGIRGTESLDDILTQMEQLYPDRCVIVLDQFEELLRYDPRIGREVLRWVEQAVRRCRVKFLISLRSEYAHEIFGYSGLDLGAARMEHYILPPLFGPTIAAEIIAHGNAATLGAAERITAEWGALSKEDDTGLIHLQALLWTLWARAKGAAIDVDAVDTIFDAASGDSAELRFAHALAASVQESIALCRMACGESSSRLVDAVLESRAAEVVLAMSGHLSSGGFKVTQERGRLAQLSLATNGVQLPTALPQEAEMALATLRGHVDRECESRRSGSTSITDWLQADRNEFLPPVSGRRFWPWMLDPDEVTSGPVFGMRLADAVFESHRAFYFALEWLRASSLVRVSTTARGKVMVSLVHDGFAAGLELWRDNHVMTLGDLTTRLLVTKGQSIRWPQPTRSTGANGLVHSNLRMQHCSIEGAVTRTTFVNCDFTGTVFRCRLEGVTFVNCMLDDAQFVGCTIVGPAPRPEMSAPIDDALPGFLVKASVPHVNSIAWYRGAGRAGELLYSPTAGLPSLPITTGSRVSAQLVEPPRAGLTLLGGRISSLTMRNCDFGEDGRIVLAEVAGTSIEFAEQEYVRIEALRCALRGVSVTRPVKPGRGTVPSELTFSDCRIINLWIGSGLSGVTRLQKCIAWQLFNAADRVMRVEFDEDTLYSGALNAPSAISPAPYPNQDTLGTAAIGVLAASATIDYRSHPVAHELRNLERSIRLVCPSFPGRSLESC